MVAAMTHYTALVRIPAARLRGTTLKAVLDTMLAPYDEQTEDARYRTFKDTTDERRKEYETGSVTKVRGPDGVMRYPWNDFYRIPGTFGTGSGTHNHDLPGHVEVEVPHREHYATFEEYLRDYCGEEMNEAGRVGYWRNPNGHWDWWQIGGRWSDRLPVQGGHADVARVTDLDQARIALEWERKIVDFHREYTALLGGKTFRAFEGPRSKALDLGLIRVVQGPAEAGPGEVLMPWSATVRPDDPRASWNDVAKVVSLDALRVTYGPCFHPLRPLVVVDENGWHEVGDIGWFGCVDADADAHLTWARQFVEVFLPSLDPTDTLVNLDCHT